MSRYLDEKQISEYRDCFNLYDVRRSGKVLCSNLISVMRALGAIPTTDEVKKYLKHFNKGPQDFMDFSQFLTLMHMHEQSVTNAGDEILKAFEVSKRKAMDERKTGTIKAEEMKHILMMTGEKLSPDEVNQMFRAAGIRNNTGVKYKDFVRKIMLPVPDY